MNLFRAGFITGALGDAGLQIADKAGYGNEGLKEYFQYQGPVISILKAALLTGFWSGAYGLLSPEPNLVGFMAFSAAVDLLYRYAHPVLYPTLAGYYEYNGIVPTMVYNAVVAWMVQKVALNWI